MCGICGIALRDPGAAASPERVGAMMERIAHRGPDAEGRHLFGPVGLGHLRLSIIDVAGGREPLANEDNTVWISYNGEIYNYLPLREQLLGLGHRFRTRSDTEVLVHAYEEWGDGFVERLNGMFAFALHDTRRGRLLLARDPLGIKPLFYEETAEGLFFGSEIKAVLAGSGTAPEPDAHALTEYLTFRYVAWDGSFFRKVRRLPPGHLGIWESGRLELRRYWAPTAFAPGPDLTLADAVDQLETLVAGSVRGQLMSEVPLGVFCSGGVDSGLVTRFAAREAPGRLDTFSVGFDDPAWDETTLARDTAARAGTEHHVVRCEPRETAALVPGLIWYHDEPLSHPNSVPLFVLSRFARQRVTVVLTGEGPDELFNGYPRHRIASLRDRLAALPEWAVAALGRAAGVLPRRRLRMVGELLPFAAGDGLVLNSRYASLPLVGALCRTDPMAAFERRRALARTALVPGDGLASIARYELSTYLQCALDRMDRMSMASGLEGRVPFLDVPLVEWGLRLPSRLKVAGGTSKLVVKALADRYLNRSITRGPKSGFGLPLDAWFRGPELKPLLERVADPDHPASAHFDPGTLRRLLDDHAAGRADHGELLWLVANVYRWHDVHVLNGGRVPVAVA